MRITQNLNKNPQDAGLYSPLTLAFLGDVVFELCVRQDICSKGSCPPKVLHKKAVEIVCASAQARAYDYILSQLTEQETDILRRGRNANGAKVPKNSCSKDYRKATGLESLFGYLYLKGDIDRINTLYSYILKGITQDKE